MIEAKGLKKLYGRDAAVDEVSFSIRRGEIVGFLGPNGAGKTTTMRMLTGYIPPTSGCASVAGFDVVLESLDVRRRVGYLPETTPLYSDLTVLEYLQFIGGLRGLAGRALADGLDRAVESCGLRKELEKDLGGLSKGYRQRVGIAQAILHSPDILILDEPTSGLDPSQVVEVRELVSALGKEKTVILSTHILSEVQAVCSRVIIISAGRIVADGTLEDLRRGHARTGGLRAQIRGASESAVREKLASLAGIGAVRTQVQDGVVQAEIDATEDLREQVFRLAVSERWVLLEMSRHLASLEDIFLDKTAGGR